MRKRTPTAGSDNGLPTALLYLGMFGCAGCLALILFLLLLAVFLWAWERLCGWSGLSAAIPSRGWRIFLGVLLYLAILVPVSVKIWKKGDRRKGS